MIEQDVCSPGGVGPLTNYTGFNEEAGFIFFLSMPG